MRSVRPRALALLSMLACARRDDAPAVSYVETATSQKYVSWRLVETRYFVTDRRCGQGPFELRVSHPAGDYGDDYVLYVYTPQGVYGHVFAVANPGDYHDKHSFGGMADNRACVLSTEEVAATPTGGQAGAATAAPLALPSGAEITERTGTAGVAIPLREIPRPERAPDGRRVEISAQRLPHFQFKYASPKTATVVYRIWSDVPNDFDGAVFVVGHRVPDYTAPAADVARADQAESDARTRATAAAREEATPQQAAVPPPPSTLPRRPPGPVGMPPPPRAETQPPRPSANATWIAGYWHWAGEQWLWLGGRWRVPPEDVARDRTVHAPAPPPPPRVEPPPATPPSPRVVFAPGYWMWDGRAFVWVAGAWQVAPEGEASWVPDHWEVRTTGGAVFVPGGWRVRVGPSTR